MLIDNRPANCVCPIDEWANLEVTPICNNFVQSHVGDFCGNCEHNIGCHSHSALSMQLTRNELQTIITTLEDYNEITLAFKIKAQIVESNNDCNSFILLPAVTNELA